ncbi:MAG TPA: DNA-3-methyladenine glycosylase [Pirellulales bacterium]|jgi:DNA-3-methyladenine glycosylase II|nr:DNA-3-methyladenine glycosylase [Pirellulales bacterium]
MTPVSWNNGPDIADDRGFIRRRRHDKVNDRSQLARRKYSDRDLRAMTLTFDPDLAVAALRRRDRTLAKIIRQAGPFTHRPQRVQSPFQSLLRAIVYQQLSGKAAATILGRVVDLCGGQRAFKPDAILAASEARLRAAGLSRGKTLSVKDLAAKTLDGTVPTLARLRKMSDDEIVERLIAVRGIGRWTVEMLLIFRLGRPDVLPLGDFGVRKGFMVTYGTAEMPSPAELLAHGERWRPYRSVASWYLWRAVEIARAAELPG